MRLRMNAAKLSPPFLAFSLQPLWNLRKRNGKDEKDKKDKKDKKGI